jgi:ferredoxin-type protein NapH
VLLVIVLLSAYTYRPFCRYLCPLGAIYAPFNKFALYRYAVDEKRCISCRACQKACKLDIPVYKTPNSADCIRCGDCRRACPAGCIRTAVRAGKVKPRT